VTSDLENLFSSAHLRDCAMFYENTSKKYRDIVSREMCVNGRTADRRPVNIMPLPAVVVGVLSEQGVEE